ncbi:type II toxin-antitoxin system RelE/ParE family toxin [Defluviicoccus vanus]|uniref:Type II toxin-antitoxin system RelE/ParE family toxin n=1 Tax=Defluviicoccus vanus TaxID=111831 RepID=A0A7H1N5U0_9PROT|nr:type II toxin-antitoxin system RelE/ParE family toxin [Defluviicoccus vanus]
MNAPLVLRLTEAAEADLVEIWVTIASEASESIASNFVHALRSSFEPLQSFPLSGPEREHLAPGLRVTFHQKYAIYYLVRPGELVIGARHSWCARHHVHRRARRTHISRVLTTIPLIRSRHPPVLRAAVGRPSYGTAQLLAHLAPNPFWAFGRGSLLLRISPGWPWPAVIPSAVAPAAFVLGRGSKPPTHDVPFG